MAASLAAPERSRFGASNPVFKSGPLFISSKGLGWKSWKKRWFILTRNSLVFFKNDPIALPQKGGEVNLTLGGIDLNNSGSVVVREDKKLLTVLFPDGRDGRAFTLKAETFEDLYEWKTALELALAQAPNAALVMGYDGIFRTETSNAIEESFVRDKRPVKPLVVGRPILLALEDIDGSPSFLEKALQFLEKYGTKVEGILRQSADVEEVVCRIQEYEQGKKDFSPDEDPHVVGDCVKHVLRELPSSPVPALCCTALLEAYKIDGKEARISSLRSAIVETFPEPNRRLVHRILKMMHTISSHSYENRMTSSAVAACMAPLLLRPLLAGECDLEDGLNTNEDNSAQLLAAANAANSAQAIVATLLEDFENIFDDEDLQRCSISADSQIGNSGPENSSDEEDIEKKDTSFCNAEIGVERETNDDNKVTLSRKWTESSDLYDYKGFGVEDSDVESPRDIRCSIERSDLPMDHLTRNSTVLVNDQEGRDKKQIQDPIKDVEISSISPIDKHCESPREVLTSVNLSTPLAASELASSTEKPASNITGAAANSKLSAFWDRGNVRKTPAKGSFDSSGDDELVIRRLEITKNGLRQRIAKEARGNSILQASLERRKQALHERRLALEQDVARLQEQLQAERDLRATLEVRLSMSCGQYSSRGVDSKTRAELEEIALAEADVARLKQKVAELHHQLNQQRHHQFNSFSDSCDYHPYIQHHNNQMRFLQQDFDSSLAFVNHEREQRIEGSILGAEWRNSRGLGFSASNMSMDQFSAIDSPSAPSASRVVDVMEHPRHYHYPSSAALLELTTRLDFFKERRLQLMEQLQNLDLNNGSSSQDFIRRRPYSPPWN